MRDFTRGRFELTTNLYSPKRKRKKWLRVFFWAAAIGFVALVAWCASLYYVITHYEGTVRDEVSVSTSARADTGIVLGATLWNDKPSPGLQERLNLALRLYREGAFEHIIVTGGLDDNGATVTEAEGMKRYLLEQGVPESAIMAEPLSRSTYENLVNSRKLMEDQGWRTAIIVTHNYHGSRAADIAKKLDFAPVQVAVTKSTVLKMSYHNTREVLAYTKWLGTKLFL
ncbi:YdcF family protein [Cohnella endophytica]|uniref:YdcF family protein n=1 Tax=Cohnella endophytica TaxID=2419778 RepID=A0A494Y9E7_9BACL|nr:YdcF family protein [Cohnella endophytica]